MKKQSGLSLLELLLVMAAGGFILTMGLQQYFTYKRDTDVLTVKSNVTQIFKAMAIYYQAACYGSTNATTITQPATGQLPQARIGIVTGGLNSPVVIDINTLLSEYLPIKLLATPTIVNLANVNGVNLTNGYYAAFSRRAAAAGELDTAVVAVHLQPGINPNAALILLDGDCVTSVGPGGSMYPCSANRTGDYVLWERMPLMAKLHDSDDWLMKPIFKQFTNMYRPASRCVY